MTPREVVEKWAGYIEGQEFEKAFSMIADDGTYTVIGKTKASRTYYGAKDCLENLMAFFSGFKETPALKFKPPIVDGNRAALFGSGKPIPCTYGVYEQPYYGYSLEIRGDNLLHVVEFMDTGEIESALLGRKFVG